MDLAGSRIVLDGGNLRAEFSTILGRGPQGTFTGPGFTVTVSESNGSFKGSVIDPVTGLPLPFAGLMLPKMNAGFGFMLGIDQSCRASIAP